MNKIKNTMRMLQKIKTLKDLGMTEEEQMRDVVNQTIYKSLRNVNIDADEAQAICDDLLDLVRRVYHPEEVEA